MGCIQQRPAKKKEFQSHGSPVDPKGSHTIQNQHNPPRNSKASDKGGKGKGLEPSSGTNGASGNEKETNSIVDKYLMETKESSYRTPGIHCYSYQPLIVFNPPTGSSEAGEKEGLEKTQGAMYIPSLTDIHNKLLLSKN